MEVKMHIPEGGHNIPVKHIKDGRKYHSIRHFERVQARNKRQSNINIINSLKSLYRPIWPDNDLTGWQAVLAVIVMLILFMVAGTLDYQSGI
jgi:hypothetical protein